MYFVLLGALYELLELVQFAVNIWILEHDSDEILVWSNSARVVSEFTGQWIPISRRRGSGVL
jgi:hypothetical protein